MPHAPSQTSPFVSVVLPSYNHEAFVTAAVESVLNQTLEDLELIVVDDASTDATADIVSSFKDPRLRLIRQTQNRATQARTLGLAEARGRYVALQNSDDVWRRDKLALQAQALAADPAAVACFSGIAVIDATGAPIPDSPLHAAIRTQEQSSTAWLRHFFDFGNCIALPSAMAPTHLVRQVGGFRGSLIQVADFDLWVRLARLGRFAIIPDALVDLRVVEDLNLGGAKSARRMRWEVTFVLERFAYPPLVDLFPAIFPDLPDAGTQGARMAALALRALDRHAEVGVSLADRLIAAVLDSDDWRRQAVEAHGVAFIHAFFHRRNASPLGPGA